VHLSALSGPFPGQLDVKYAQGQVVVGYSVAALVKTVIKYRLDVAGLVRGAEMSPRVRDRLEDYAMMLSLPESYAREAERWELIHLANWKRGRGGLTDRFWRLPLVELTGFPALRGLRATIFEKAAQQKDADEKADDEEAARRKPFREEAGHREGAARPRLRPRESPRTLNGTIAAAEFRFPVPWSIALEGEGIRGGGGQAARAPFEGEGRRWAALFLGGPFAAASRSCEEEQAALLASYDSRAR